MDRHAVCRDFDHHDYRWPDLRGHRERGKAPLALAVVVLVLGLGLALLSTVMRPADTHEVRTGNVPNMVAMSKARHPTWVVFLGPVIGTVGVVIGGKLRRRS